MELNFTHGVQEYTVHGVASGLLDLALTRVSDNTDEDE